MSVNIELTYSSDDFSRVKILLRVNELINLYFRKLSVVIRIDVRLVAVINERRVTQIRIGVLMLDQLTII